MRKGIKTECEYSYYNALVTLFNLNTTPDHWFLWKGWNVIRVFCTFVNNVYKYKTCLFAYTGCLKIIAKYFIDK